MTSMLKDLGGNKLAIYFEMHQKNKMDRWMNGQIYDKANIAKC